MLVITIQCLEPWQELEGDGISLFSGEGEILFSWGPRNTSWTRQAAPFPAGLALHIWAGWTPYLAQPFGPGALGLTLPMATCAGRAGTWELGMKTHTCRDQTQ